MFLFFLKVKVRKVFSHLDERGIILHFCSVERRSAGCVDRGRCGTSNASRLLTFGHEVPPCRIQRVRCTPRDVSTVCFTSAILEYVSRSIFGLVVEYWELVDGTHPPKSVADDESDE